MNSNILVSIITPVYNSEFFLPETILSVLAQTYTQWELFLILDQKSTDNSSQVCKNFAQKDARIKVISNQNCLGVANNRNEGLVSARGKYIAFLDSDDIWEPVKLQKQLEFMVTHNCKFSFHDFQPIDQSGNYIGKVRKAPTKICYNDLLHNNTIGCLTVMLAKEICDKIRFRTNVHHEDFVFWLDTLQLVDLGYGIKESLSKYRIIKGSRSANKISSALGRWYIYRKILNFSFFKSVYYFFWYGISGVIKR